MGAAPEIMKFPRYHLARSAMAPKRARTAAAATSASSSSQSAASATTKLTLDGGVPHHPALAGLWRDERLTDFAVSAEGVRMDAAGQHGHRSAVSRLRSGGRQALRLRRVKQQR